MDFIHGYEIYEVEHLSEFASKSVNSKGRSFPEQKSNIKTEFQIDRDRILNSKAFRRLKHKTQVFISPKGDHYRTRLTHTLEVSQISRTIARALRLNEDLVEAIALGHDLGHTPFGHSGEQILNSISPNGFKHNLQSIRVVEIIENGGNGLNLTWEIKDGILNHRTDDKPSTLEGKIVQLSDKIAYINHDIDDAIRGRVILENDLPKECTKIIGDSSSKRIDNMIENAVKNSIGKNDICMSQQMKEAMYKLRSFLFQNVYIDSIAKAEESKAKNIVKQLYQYFMIHTDELSEEFKIMISNNKWNTETIVCDYIAGMTDIYAKNMFCKIFVPSSWDIY